MQGKTLAIIGIIIVYVLFSLSAWFGCGTLGSFFFAEGALTAVILLILSLVVEGHRLIDD